MNTMQNNDTSRDDELREKLRQAREQVEHLVDDLRSVDSEIAGLDTERHQYGVLQDICRGFDELEEIGASHLFWDSQSAGGSGPDQLRNVRSRIAGFEKRLAEMDERRQSILDQIQLQEDTADFLAGDVLAAEKEEAERLLEWQIEREVHSIPIRPSIMPWQRGGEDDQRFRKSLAISLLVSLLIAIVLPMIDIPIPERWEVLDETERLTRLIREERPLPPVAQLDIPIPETPQEATPVEEENSAAADELVPESAPAANPSEKPSAGSKGLLAFRKKFSGLAQNQNVDRLGSNARISDPADLAKGLPQRSMVTSEVPGSSGGINVAELSRGTGGSGQAMSGVAVTKATSSIGTGSGNGTGRPTSGGGGPGLGRTDEEIQIVFDRHKASLYRLYNRELRKNPTLKGQMVLRMTIEPDGSVSMCEVKSSDLDSPALSKSVASRVRGFDFGAKDGIPAVTIVYPIDFLPAT
jgi:hypothetical protein